MDDKWAPESSKEELKFVPNEPLLADTSSLLGRLLEHIKRCGRDERLDMELFDELYQMEDSQVKAVFKEVSKIPFRKADTAQQLPNTFVPKTSWRYTRITSRGAQVYRPHYVCCPVRLTKGSIDLSQTSRARCGSFDDWLPKGMKNMVAIYSVLPSTKLLIFQDVTCRYFFSFTFFAPNMRFKHVGLISVSGGPQDQRYFFRPIIFDISSEGLSETSTDIPRTLSAATASSSNSSPSSNNKKSSKSCSVVWKSETGKCGSKLQHWTAAYPSSPPIWNAISAFSRELIFNAVLRLEGEWSISPYRLHLHVGRKWPALAAPPSSPDDMPPDFLQTLKWHSQHQHENLAPVVAASTLNVTSPILLFDAPPLDVGEFVTSHAARTGHHATPDMIYPILIAIAMGLEHLHATGKCHGRFQPVCARIASPRVVRIIDHDNFSRITPPKALRFIDPPNTPAVITDVYAAPELFGAEEYKFSMDSFAFGLVMWYLIYQEQPRTRSRDILDGVVPSISHSSESASPLDSRVICDHYFEFLRLDSIYTACTHRDPEKRPSFGELVSRLSILYSDWQAKPQEIKATLHPISNVHTQ
jgi:hypothetical protein